MSCMLCTSDNRAEFTAKIMIHFLRQQEHQQSGRLIVPEGCLLGLRFFRIYHSRRRVAETKGREGTLYDRFIATSVFGVSDGCHF